MHITKKPFDCFGIFAYFPDIYNPDIEKKMIIYHLGV